MSAPDDSDGRSSGPPEGQGVLANLPRTRPQRSSPRRAAARRAASANGAVRIEAAAAEPAAPTPPPATGRRTPRRATVAAGRPRKPGATKSPAGSAAKPRTRGASGRPGPGAHGQEPVPRQGFECEGEGASGTVQPPGGAELVSSAMEIVGELAKAGLSTGERLLRDALSRLPLS
ncbi:MAG TPA: hypothetical protein VES97_00510 [Solirubrobacteraceae bacterium]|nr:hypothetical protein [Solirubrobacteraceae bacterium]